MSRDLILINKKMYWFNITDILEEANEPLTADQIFLKHLEVYGHASKKRIVTVLKKLVLGEKVEVQEKSIKKQRGRHFIYFLKK